MKLADWITLAVLGAIVAAIVLARKRSGQARTAALSAAHAAGHAAALASVTAVQRLDLGGVHIGSRDYGVGGEGVGSGGRIAADSSGGMVPVIDAAGVIVAYRRVRAPMESGSLPAADDYSDSVPLVLNGGDLLPIRQLGPRSADRESA